MKIDSSAPIRTTPARRRSRARSKGGSASFADHVGGLDDSGIAPAASTQEPVAVNPLLAVQEVADATSGNARARAHGDAMLDRLDEIRLGLLFGHVPKERLEDLVRLVRTKRTSGADSRLNGVLDDIELRARVELAKLSIGA